MPSSTRGTSRGRKKGVESIDSVHLIPSLQQQFKACPPSHHRETRSLRQRRRLVEAEKVLGTTTKVFLYGTLKRGFTNYNAYLSCAVTRGQASYLYAATTVSSLDLIVWGDRDVPGLVEGEVSAEGGHHVLGEVFEIDLNTLAALDNFFEGGPALRLYKRRVIETRRVTMSHNTTSNAPVESMFCWLLQDPRTVTDRNETRALSVYTREEQATHHAPTFQPHVLELMTGVDAEHFQHFYDDTRTSFEDVWREALGHSAQFKECHMLRLSDSSFNHIFRTSLLLNLFRLVGCLFWLVGPLSVMYVLWNYCGNIFNIFDLNSSNDAMDYMTESNKNESWWCLSWLSWLWWYVRMWMHLEAFFWCLMQFRIRHYGVPVVPRTIITTKEWREREFHRYARMEFQDKTRGREWIMGFFLHVGITNGGKLLDSIKYYNLRRDNLFDMWLARLFDANNVGVLNEVEKNELESYVNMTVDMLGGGEEGRNKGVKLMNPRFDPLVVEHHPLLFYVVTELIFEVIISWCLLRWHGFIVKRTNGMKYWMKKGTRVEREGVVERSDTSLPLMMFPGVGVGFLPYMSFFQKLGLNRDLFLVELPYISLRICGGFDVFSKKKIITFVKQVCIEHEMESLHLIGHSFGTSCVSMCMKDPLLRDHIVHEVTMIDPVPFSVQYGNILRNFIYNPYDDGRVYIINREPHLVHAMMRQMVYSDVVLWPGDLKKWRNPPIVIISGKDTIIPSSRIKELLMQRRYVAAATNLEKAEQEQETKAPVVLVWLSDMDHGGFLFDKQVRKEVENCVLFPPRPLENSAMLYKLVPSSK